MKTTVKIGEVWGIPIGVHISWFLIFIMLTWSLTMGYFPEEYTGLTDITYLALGLVTSLLFFGSVLAHELGHSYLAIKSKIPVKGINLYIFGGIAQISKEPDSPRTEFLISVAGPLISILLSILFGGIWLADKNIPILAAPSVYLMRINFLLAIFNLIPGFPLDGGRILRALVWWVTKSFQRATRIASYSGQMVALGFIGVGVYTIFNGELLNGLWLAFIGWFLQNAASSAYKQMNMQEALQGITVGQVMVRECIRVSNLTTINRIVEDMVLSGGQRCFFVAENGKLRGMVTLRDITEVPKRKWKFTTAEQTMVPMHRLVKVSPDVKLMKALQTMDEANVAQVPVVDGDELVGVLSREQIVHYIRTRAELGM